MTSVRKSYITKSFKKRKTITSEKFRNVWAFDKESKRKLQSFISTDSFIKNN